MDLKSYLIMQPDNIANIDILSRTFTCYNIIHHHIENIKNRCSNKNSCIFNRIWHDTFCCTKKLQNWLKKANVPIMKIIPSKRPLYKAVLATFLASSLFPRPSSLEIYEPAPLPNNSPNPTIT